MATLAGNPRVVDGPDERFTGYGVMGMPFASGHYLVLRGMLATSIGPAYRAIWHRAPDGHWSIFTTIDPDLSCPRYFGTAATSSQVPNIDISWPDDWTLQVTMDDRVSWRMQVHETMATRMMTSMGGAMPDAAWNSDPILTGMGPMAGGFLQSGRIRLRGVTPNGPWFKGAPLQVWRVDGEARVDGVDLGPTGPLPEQTHLTDFWMPQRGLFWVGRASFAARRVMAPTAAAA